MQFSSDAMPLDPYGAMVSLREPTLAVAGPLAGMRLCVKDNIAVEGEPFTSGHPAFAGRRAGQTAPAVERLLKGGAAFVGMTRTDSGGFGMTTPCVTNPVWPGCTVGGSSGGAAAAVAAGLADIGLGTDTGGSIRVPAACTAIYGFKPSHGRVPVAGIDPMAPSFDHLGLLARSFDKLRLAAGVLLNDDMSAGDGQSLVLAVEDRMPDFADAATVTKFEQLQHILRRAGHRVVVCSLPDRRPLTRVFGALVLSEAAGIYASLTKEERSQLGPAAARALDILPDISTIEDARKLAETVKRAYEVRLSECDAILSPTIFITPPERGASFVEIGGRQRAILPLFLEGTCFGNLVGAPAMALPVKGATPFSLHVMTKKGADRALFTVSECILTALDASLESGPEPHIDSPTMNIDWS